MYAYSSAFFAEDTGIFEKNSFAEYISASQVDGSDLGGKLMQLFDILDTPQEQRMHNLPTNLARFRYINGNLFSEKLPTVIFDEKMRKIILECCDFDWSNISPAIFGAMFQGVMTTEQRRELGAHYTSEENIMKVIKPLFLDDLYQEFERSKATRKELDAFHDKIASLKFLDPACGSGNFLILTYQKLRELEFEILKYLENTSQLELFDYQSKVHINQFFGIEYEPFACEIAKISMLLIKHLMDQKINNYFGINVIDFPIKENANIINANALRINWEPVDYILGNPPFVGKKFRTDEQNQDLQDIFPPKTKTGILDYVTAWFYKGSVVANNNSKVRIAFVSTNSICQGEQVAPLWQAILKANNCKIDFAYRSFKWTNEAKGKAGVNCIIIGFSNKQLTKIEKAIFLQDGSIEKAININGYLLNTEDIFIDRRTSHIQKLLKMEDGNVPLDGNFLKVEPEEYEEFKVKEPQAIKYIKKLVGSENLIHKTERYVLWFTTAPSIAELKSMPLVAERVKKVREFRLNSKEKATQKIADRPYQFRDLRNPSSALVIPRVSSENILYIPIGFIDKSTIALNSCLILNNADLVYFAIITSSTHMLWIRKFAGRLESRYRYSASVVYNNFPFPELSEESKQKLTQTAQKILDVRALYPNDSFADLYNDNFMPADLRKAHAENDKAVWEAYGKAWDFGNEEQCIAHLMQLYKQLTTKN